MRIDKLPSGRAPSLGRNLAPCTGCLQIPWEHFATQRLPDPPLQHPLTGRLGTPCGAGLPTLYRDPPVSLCTRSYVFSIKSHISDRVQCIFGRLGSGNCLKASRYTSVKISVLLPSFTTLLPHGTTRNKSKSFFPCANPSNSYISHWVELNYKQIC